MGNLHNSPFTALGSALCAVRLKSKEPLAEVAAAVEVSIERLRLFEEGELRPSEEILELIISHFTLPEKDADKLWELAGFDKKSESAESFEYPDTNQQNIMVTPLDARIVYTDMVHVMVNNYGVVMNFMQGAGPNNQPLAVSRIGMSREHAKSVLEVLQKTLDQVDSTPKMTKKLEAPDANKKSE